MKRPSDRPGSSRKPKPRGYLLLAVVMLFILAACSGSAEGGGGETGLTPQDGELVSRGAEVFQASCSGCHGTDVRGTDNGPSLLSEVYEPDHHADVAFLFAVQRGSAQHHWRFGDMPPIDGITDDDVAAVVAYVRETQRIEGFEPYPPPATTTVPTTTLPSTTAATTVTSTTTTTMATTTTTEPELTAADLYAVNCAVCHGANLEGGVGPALGAGGHAHGHDDAELVDIVANGRNVMPAFGDQLSEDQIRDLVAFIRAADPDA